MLQLTQDNYHSIQANLEYMSRSQYKGFVYECEAKEMAKLSGAWVDGPSIAFDIGDYVHSWNDGTQQEFITNHPNMFKQDLSLKSDYLVANKMIACLENDPFAMFYLEGEKDKIMAAEMFGVTWKIRLNVQNIERRRIVDLVTTRSITMKVLDEVANQKVSFVEFYKFPLHAAIYTEVERLAMGRAAGDWSEFLLVAVSKEKYPDKAVINMRYPDHLNAKLLAGVEVQMPRIIALKAGLVEPLRCRNCDYCRASKVLNGEVNYIAL